MDSRQCPNLDFRLRSNTFSIYFSEKACPATFDYDPTKQFCHKFVDVPRSFADAISYCKTLGAHLVVVNNEEENSHIENKLRNIASMYIYRFPNFI